MPPEEIIVTERRFTFDAAARLYDDARPQYPDAVFEDIVGWAGLRPDDAILEIGCGSGQATEGFASRGLAVTAIDPGANLIAIAREKLARFPKVEFVETTFEDFEPRAAAFRLVVAAQSLHWVAPKIRFGKAATMLAADGAFAVLANVPMPLDPLLSEALERAYAAHAPSLSGPPAENWYLPGGPISVAWAGSEIFAAPVHRCYRWSKRQTSRTYLALLATLSSHNLLAAPIRDRLFAAIEAVIDDHGGVFEMRYETHLYMARRR
jgi:SAM-dependent methyltransferase